MTDEILIDEIIEEPIEYIEPEPIVVVDLEKEQHEIEEDGVIYIEESTYRVFSDGSKVLACTSKYPKPSDEPVVPGPTEEELIQAEILLNQVEILAKQNEHDEVLAEILLNQMGV